MHVAIMAAWVESYDDDAILPDMAQIDVDGIVESLSVI